jgi:hypothetical protein
LGRRDLSAGSGKVKAAEKLAGPHGKQGARAEDSARYIFSYSIYPVNHIRIPCEYYP